MSNRVYMVLHKVQAINLDEEPMYPSFPEPYYEIVCYDDYNICQEDLGSSVDIRLSAEINEVFTPKGALQWLLIHQPEFSSMVDYVLEHGMYILDDWCDPEEMHDAMEEVG
jgi:hypothetical protein